MRTLNHALLLALLALLLPGCKTTHAPFNDGPELHVDPDAKVDRRAWQVLINGEHAADVFHKRTLVEGRTDGSYQVMDTEGNMLGTVIGATGRVYRNTPEKLEKTGMVANDVSRDRTLGEVAAYLLKRQGEPIEVLPMSSARAGN